jgi:hypothetical protein
MPNFTIEGRKAGQVDIVRNYMFELSIPAISSVVPIVSPEGLITRVKTAIIPGSTIDPIESDWMGTKQFFPGKKTPTTEMSVTFEETEDMVIHNAMTIWMEAIQTLDYKNVDSAGSSQFAKKRDGYATDLELKVYSYDGNRILRKIIFKNAWPTSIGDGTLDYSAADAVNFDVTFKFDTWIVDL